MTKPQTLLLCIPVLACLCSCSGGSSSVAEESMEPGMSDDGGGNEPGNGQVNNPDNGLNDPATQALSEANINEVILQAFDVLSGRAYDQRLLRFPYLREAQIANTDGDGSTRAGYLTQQCDNAGQASNTTSPYTVDNDTSIQNSTSFSDCQLAGDVLNGNVVVKDVFNPEFAREFSDNFTVAFAPAGTLKVQGTINYRPSIDRTREFGVENFTYELSYAGGTLIVSDANTLRTFQSGRRSSPGSMAHMEGSFRMQSPALAGTEVTVEVLEPFSNDTLPSQLRYTQGQMRISTDNAIALVDANTGNASTVAISLAIDGMALYEKEEPWSAWTAALAYVPPEIQAGQYAYDHALVSGNTVVTAQNYRPLLQQVFDITTGDLYGAEILDLPEYQFPEFPYVSPGQQSPDGLGEPMTIDCSNGGSVLLRPYQWGARQVTTGWNAEFTDCDDAGVRRNGFFFTRDFGNFRNSGRITLQSDAVEKVFDGTLDYQHSANRDGGPSRIYALSAHRASGLNESFGADSGSQPAGSVSELSDATIIHELVEGFAQMMAGEFNFKSRESDNQVLHAQFADPFVVSGSDPGNLGPFQFGTLLVGTTNGNLMRVDVDNGDTDTFQVSIVTPDADTQVFTERWSDWQSHIEFNYDLHSR